ncbi:thiamine phosphate synthase [Chloroflexi bacterium]|nr:thiamine phosphate synthase [Chloroflexota bacterium]
MNELLTSVCIDILQFVPNDEVALKTNLGLLIGTENLSKFDIAGVEEPERGLNLCIAALALADSDKGDTGHVRECIQRVKDYFSLQLRLLHRRKMTGIYIIVDPEATNNVDVYEMTKMSLAGGVKVVQYRDKLNDREPFLENCYRIKELCHQYKAAFVINDAVDVASITSADFLHVGQSDMPVKEARMVLQPFQGIGRSNGGTSESTESEEYGVDYLAVGAIYPTSTMGKSARNPLGPAMITNVKSQSGLPIVAIGGITIEKLPDVIHAGADSVCMVSAITMSEDPESSARELVNVWESST